MVFQHIEKLKREYTDKYVVVDESQPELLRFKDQTGVVRTVNMNGRALVEFDAYENIGWFDIDVDFLKIIDEPLPKKEPEPAKKPAAKKPAAPKADAKASGGKMSVAEMMAAARAEKGGAAAKPDTKKEAPPKPEGPKASQSMSVAEMLAAARGEKSGGGAPAAESAPEPAAEPTPEPEPEPAAEAAPEPEAAAPKGDLPTDVAGMIEYCRKVDG